MTVRIMTPGVVKLDGTSGTLSDISAQVVDCSVTPRLTVGSYYTLASRDEVTVEGKVPRGYDISMTIVKTDGASDAYAIIESWLTGTSLAAKTIELYDPDTTTGSHKATGEVVLVSVGPVLRKAANSGDAQTVTVQMRATNGLTLGTVLAT